MNTTTRKKNSAQSALTSKKSTSISKQHIRQRAFEIYLERGAVPGHEEEDWQQAERELMQSVSR